MFKERKRRRAREQGFQHALVYGRPDPGWTDDDTWKVAYHKGFREGEEAVKRIVKLAQR